MPGNKDSSGNIMCKVFIDMDSPIRVSSNEVRYWMKGIWTKAGQLDCAKRMSQFGALYKKHDILAPKPPAYVLSYCSVTKDRRSRTIEVREYDRAGQRLGEFRGELPLEDYPYTNIEPGSLSDICWRRFFENSAR